MSPADSGTIDVACELLADSRRRSVLYELREADVTTIDDLIQRIVADESTESSGPDKESVHIDLVHHHLPKLEQCDVLEYDQRNSDVVRRDGFDDVRPLLERTHELESEYARAMKAEPSVHDS